MVGGGSFSYESAFASTIASNSVLHLTEEMTFAYAPVASIEPATRSQQNILLTDKTSRIVCDGITLDISDAGLQLTKGTLELYKANTVESAALPTNYDDGLILGNGTFLEDLNLVVNPEASINVNSGVLNYQNAEFPVPLRIGDAVALKHKTHGFFLAPTPGLTSPVSSTDLIVVGSVGVATNTYFHWDIRPGEAFSSAWGYPSQVGNNVVSGDFIHLTPHDLETTTSLPWEPGYLFLIALHTTGAPVSSPSSTYKRASTYKSAHAAFMPHRIYKKGANVGDIIYQGDEIYIYRFNDNWNGGGEDFSHNYLGSSDVTYLTTEKEVYFYREDPVSTTPPPTFETDFIWIAELVTPDAHLTAPPYLQAEGADITTIAPNWPDPNVYQF
jgi:hypothetical protein